MTSEGLFLYDDIEDIKELIKIFQDPFFLENYYPSDDEEEDLNSGASKYLPIPARGCFWNVPFPDDYCEFLLLFQKYLDHYLNGWMDDIPDDNLQIGQIFKALFTFKINYDNIYMNQAIIISLSSNLITLYQD